MTYTVQVLDETTTRPRPQPAMTLEFEHETVTVRELIRRRIYEDCLEYNVGQRQVFKGLVTPETAERSLNGQKAGRGRQLDWQRQFRKAVEGFERNGLIVLIGEEQAIDLEQPVQLTLRKPLDVTFIKLIPLVGG